MRFSSSTRVLLLTEFYIGPTQRRQARESGALCFLSKNVSLEDVGAAIRTAAATPVPLASEADPRVVDRVRRLRTLTAREIEVLQVLRNGLSIQGAAEELSLSSGTVKNHLHSILVKTDAHSQVEALILAEEEGFISGP